MASEQVFVEQVFAFYTGQGLDGVTKVTMEMQGTVARFG